MALLLIYTLALVGIIPFSVYLRLSKRMCRTNVSMKGKVVIVTGGNSNIGFHAALNLARRGARVILACRDEARAAAARDRIIMETRNTQVEFRQLNLSSFKSIRKFAANILETEDQLHVLVNNAGVYGYSELTEDGIVETMQINYFGHFLLTLLLLPLLKKSQPSRIINLSSIFHFMGRFNPKTINTIQPFLDGVLTYSNSKFCMLLFTLELARRLKGSGVVVNAIHPGLISTDITSHNCNIVIQLIFRFLCLLYNRTPNEGAQTIEYLAVAEECAEVSGKYFVDCESRFFLWTAKDEKTAKELWDYSVRIVGLNTAGQVYS